jgi:very-short-patch-repair endonuclease
MFAVLGLKRTIPLRRTLRRNQTPAEKIFWSKISNKQFHGLKFVKQHGIGKYIVDFCCRSKKMIIEIDGDSHATTDGIKSDIERSEYLKTLGYRIIRYNNRDVLNNIDGVFEDLGQQTSS